MASKDSAELKRRIVSAQPVEDDASFELKLRPRRLAEFIGQGKVKENLAVAIEAARSRGEALDHVLLYGPPGLGKTTLASIIANELGVEFQQTSAPVLQIKGDLTAILTNIRVRQVMFFDEVHRLQPALEELLYSALEDYRLDIIIGQGPSARTHTIDVHPFTFVGATTRAGLISGPLRSRFGIVLRLEFYAAADLEIIVKRSAEILDVAVDAAGAREIAARARGTPRIANRLLRRVRDYAQVRGGGNIDLATAQAALEMLEVDKHGFDDMDRRLLLTIIEKYQGGPVGVNTLAAALAEEAIAKGFDEVQFDYVRFPDEPRSRMVRAVFPSRRKGELPREAVRRQVQLLTGLVKPLGVPVTFDVFGLTASATGDLGIGQVWEDFVDVADVVLPMVYPSHYTRGAFGLRTPNAHPYNVVRLALIDALARSRDPSAAQIRPYLQAFTLGRRLPRYTPFEIREQIRAANDLGIESWVLWNPRSVYLRAALPPYPSGMARVAASGGE